MSLAKALQKLIDDPDDLTQLPKIIAQVQTLEDSEFSYQERISKLQNLNKEYLSQIPIEGNEPPDEEEKEVPVTLQDAKNYMTDWSKGE